MTNTKVMKVRNERTGRRVARIAGHILTHFKCNDVLDDLTVFCHGKLCTAGDLKALAASALTQSPDRKPKLLTHSKAPHYRGKAKQ